VIGMVPIHIRDLVFRPQGRTVIDGLSATIRPEGITAIVGPNGAGKSVALRLIDGLLRPDGGSIRFGDRPPDSVRRAFVFQKPGLIHGSVRRNAALALAPLRLSHREAAERVDAALHKVGLRHRAEEAARKLSGGEQQRLALARALVVRPELLLLDEPTASLDPSATEAIEELVIAFAQGGTKVLLVSHNLGQVARLASDVLVLSRGKAVEHGPAHAILAAPRTSEARAYIKGELPWTSFAAAC
jgi:tungstate transport system ATP-binding protein